MIDEGKTPKALRVRELGVYRGVFYYKKKKLDKDWQLKCHIEEVLREHPSYGSRRVALHLQMNRKKVKRVMNIFGIKAYRRRGRKWKRTKNIKVIYPNLLLTEYPVISQSYLAVRFHLHTISRQDGICGHSARCVH